MRTLVTEANKNGIPCVLWSGFRPTAEQQRLYDLGRTIINPDGKTDKKPMGNIITNSRPGNSYHEYGLAGDVVPLNKFGNPTWNLPFDSLGAMGKKLGLEWGGDWKRFPDKPHFQMSFGYSISELKRIVAANGLKGLWDRISRENGDVAQSA